MLKKEILETEKTILELFKEKGISVSKIIVFGSYGRKKEKEESIFLFDLVICVKFKGFFNIRLDIFIF